MIARLHAAFDKTQSTMIKVRRFKGNVATVLIGVKLEFDRVDSDDADIIR